MTTSLERLRAKISELEGQLVNLRIAERELTILEDSSPQKTRHASKSASLPARKTAPDVVRAAGLKQTIGATITEILNQHGTLTVPGIAEHVHAAGRDISNRAISFGLQALKRHGLVKSSGGEWTLRQSRRKRP
jgi:hypothetical protein